MRRIILLAAALAFGTAGAQDYVFGIVFDAGGKFDGSFNEGTWRGLVRGIENLEEEQGLEIDLLEFEGTPDTSAQGLRNISEQGAELVVAPGFSQADSIASVSQEFPFTNYVLIDGVVEAENVRSVLFKEHEGGFLVGYLAGLMTRTGTVGFVGGMDIPLIRNFDVGYQQGVRAACPSCEIISNYVGTTPSAWNDPARAKELASSQRAQGADIIYAAAGASGNGVIDFVNETMCFTPSDEVRTTPLRDVPVYDAYASNCGENAEPLFFIGVDSNQNFRGDTDDDPSTLNHGLTSMLKRVDVAAENAAYDVVDGTFEGGLQSLGVAEDGVGWALDEYNEDLIPQSVIDQLAGIRDAIVEGEITVESYQ
ncbi:MAG: BMP family ABC transporter substrate-binding protein [Trueperaceae bacterium]|nr:BMP family ABC transporter substrate-binding protein [Trueperaceae bacterium]